MKSGVGSSETAECEKFPVLTELSSEFHIKYSGFVITPS